MTPVYLSDVNVSSNLLTLPYDPCLNTVIHTFEFIIRIIDRFKFTVYVGGLL